MQDQVVELWVEGGVCRNKRLVEARKEVDTISLYLPTMQSYKAYSLPSAAGAAALSVVATE